jgi:hypothetical protein
MCEADESGAKRPAGEGGVVDFGSGLSIEASISSPPRRLPIPRCRRRVRQLSILIIDDRAQGGSALVLAFGAAAGKSCRPGRTRPGQDLQSVAGRLGVKNATGFLIGFAAASTPILIYGAWVVWRIAEAI